MPSYLSFFDITYVNHYHYYTLSFCHILSIISTLSFRSQASFTKERIEELKTLSQLPDIYKRLAKALGKCNSNDVMRKCYERSNRFPSLSQPSHLPCFAYCPVQRKNLKIYNEN